MPETDSAAARSDTALLREAMRFFEIEQRRVLVAFGPLTQSRLMVMLLRRGSLSQAEVARISSLEKSWVSRAVDRLEESGWVQRRPHQTDGRCQVLSLTEAGLVQARDIDAALDAHANEVLTRLPDGARTDVMAALGALREVLQHPVCALTTRKP